MPSNVSLLRRLGAMAYDAFLVFSLVFFIVGIMLLLLPKENWQNNSFIFVVNCGIVYCYFAWSWVKGGQTLGMKAWRFRITQNNGEPITHQQALLRFLLALISLSLLGLGFIYQLFHAHNLAWHDQYSNTYLTRLIQP